MVCNMAPVPHQNYRVGVPKAGCWKVVVNTDASTYGGTNMAADTDLESELVQAHGENQSVCLLLPAATTLLLGSTSVAGNVIEPAVSANVPRSPPVAKSGKQRAKRG
jgi:hypothetical protein